MYDALVRAARALQGESSAGRVIVLITDGQETTSRATLRDSVAAAREAQAIVYPSAVRDTTFTPKPLRALAAGTGGQMSVVTPNDPLVDSYRQIASQLRSTWRISYLTAVRPGAPVDLSAREAGGSVARATIPLAAAKPQTGRSTLPFNELAIALAALCTCGVVFGVFRGVRARSGGSDLY